MPDPVTTGYGLNSEFRRRGGDATLDAYDNGADMIVTPCQLCQANVEIYQSEINKKQGTKFNMPVVDYSQLMTDAYGGSASDAGRFLSVRMSRNILYDADSSRAMSEMDSKHLDFVWDDTKAKTNIAKHGVPFPLAATVLLDPFALTAFDSDHSVTEERWFTLGRAGNGSLLAVSHTYQLVGPAEALVRIISAREPTRREREQYENG